MSDSTNTDALVALWKERAQMRRKLALNERDRGEIDVALCYENKADAYQQCADELELVISRTHRMKPRP